MPQHRVAKVVITMDDGSQHTVEGEGHLSVARTSTTVPGTKKDAPTARVEIVMPLEAEKDPITGSTLTPGFPLR